jgi:hypothetical protein
MVAGRKVKRLLPPSLSVAAKCVLPSWIVVARSNFKRWCVSTWSRNQRCYSDALKSYDGLDADFAHQVVDHAVQYVDGQIHTNGLENFWSLLKRGISGTYVSVEPYHLGRYVDEQVFRYNHREATDAERFVGALSQIAGRRLTWEQLMAVFPGGHQQCPSA